MILFRADGNSNIGLGHVMRCLSIADAFKNSGESCLFITADNELHKIIKDRGHKNLVLDSEYDHMDTELGGLKQAIDSRDVDVVFVDSYYVTEHYLRELWQFCSRKYITLVYVDDVLSFPYPCDVLLNYNIYAKDEDYKKLYKNHALPTLLMGTKYTPQRAEFQDLPDRKVKEDAKDILISTGGADSEHIGLEIIKFIHSHSDWNDYRFHLVVGMMNSDRNEIESLSEGKDNIIIYKRVKNMSELMQSCDVAVSAAGSTLYELCSTQTPTITYILADNQIPGAEGFENAGVLHCAGDIRDIGASALAEKMINDAIALCNGHSKRKEIAQKMKTVIDGKGAERVVDEVTEVWNLGALDQLSLFIKNFNMHYSLLLRRYKRFKEINEPQNTDIDIMTYLDLILVQLRSICLEYEKYHNNYTAQNLLHKLGRDDLADAINAMLEEQFFDYRNNCTVREAIKILTDDYVCHYDSIEEDELAWSGMIEKQLRNPYIKRNLDYIIQVLMKNIGEGLSLDNLLSRED